MTASGMEGVRLVELWRGEILESLHCGHVVICGPDGEIEEAWGNPDQVILPRSSAKMLQALPLVESGAAARAGLGPQHLALACASHEGTARHAGLVSDWLADQGMVPGDLLCGAQSPWDRAERNRMICAEAALSPLHNNCSGKHAGFLTLSRDLGAGADYIDMAHPVQAAALAAHEEVTGETSPGYGIDGCAAPNHATTLHGLARAMSRYATAGGRADARSRAQAALTEAMMAHPDLVAGDGRPCTELMRATTEPVAIKFGADGVFIAILPAQGRGVAIKISDGATRGVDCVIAAVLVRLGVLDPAHPSAQRFLTGPIRNRRGDAVARLTPVRDLIGAANFTKI